MIFKNKLLRQFVESHFIKTVYKRLSCSHRRPYYSTRRRKINRQQTSNHCRQTDITAFYQISKPLHVLSTTYRTTDITDNIFVILNAKAFFRFNCFLHVFMALKYQDFGCFQNPIAPPGLYKLCWRFFFWPNNWNVICRIFTNS